MLVMMPVEQKIAIRVYKLQNNLWYALFIVCLAVVSIGLLFYELWYPGATSEQIARARKFDTIIAWVFLTDFFAGLYFSKYTQSRRVFFKHNWLNLVSSLPFSHELAHALRILRIVRALRVVRAGTNFWFAEERQRYVKKEHSSPKHTTS